MDNTLIQQIHYKTIPSIFWDFDRFGNLAALWESVHLSLEVCGFKSSVESYQRLKIKTQCLSIEVLDWWVKHLKCSKARLCLKLTAPQEHGSKVENKFHTPRCVITNGCLPYSCWDFLGTCCNGGLQRWAVKISLQYISIHLLPLRIHMNFPNDTWMLWKWFIWWRYVIFKILPTQVPFFTCSLLHSFRKISKWTNKVSR